MLKSFLALSVLLSSFLAVAPASADLGCDGNPMTYAQALARIRPGTDSADLGAYYYRVISKTCNRHSGCTEWKDVEPDLGYAYRYVFDDGRESSDVFFEFLRSTANAPSGELFFEVGPKGIAASFKTLDQKVGTGRLGRYLHFSTEHRFERIGTSTAPYPGTTSGHLRQRLGTTPSPANDRLATFDGPSVLVLNENCGYFVTPIGKTAINEDNWVEYKMAGTWGVRRGLRKPARR